MLVVASWGVEAVLQRVPQEGRHHETVHVQHQENKVHRHLDVPFDVCDSVTSHGKCIHLHCNGSSGQSYALGLISRDRTSTKPTELGNSQGSYCAVSKKYKFIFLHTLKNAGTATKNWLKGALCSDGGVCDREILSIIGCSSALKTHPHFLRWTWARHPFERAMSIYGMAKQYGLPAETTFEEFWLDTKRWTKTKLSYTHGLPQSMFMTNSRHCLSVDFVGWLPDGENELRRIAALVKAPPLEEYLSTHGFQRPKKGNVFGHGELRREHFKSGVEAVSTSPKLLQFLSKMYETDLKNFGRTD